jgi:hypothetical protein
MRNGGVASYELHLCAASAGYCRSFVFLGVAVDLTISMSSRVPIVAGLKSKTGPICHRARRWRSYLMLTINLKYTGGRLSKPSHYPLRYCGRFALSTVPKLLFMC